MRVFLYIYITLLFYIIFPYYCSSGNGKSFYIQSRMEELGYATIVLAINEGFSPKKCIKVLSTVSEDNDFCAVHLNFTLPFLEVSAVSHFILYITTWL